MSQKSKCRLFQSLELDVGVKLILDRSAAGGISKKTLALLKAVLNKFLPFLARKNICHWNQVEKHHLGSYSAWLGDKGYTLRTRVVELMVIKTVMRILVAERRLPEACQIT